MITISSSKIYSVYIIKNKINRKVYIGFTSNKVSWRFNQHIYETNGGRNHHLNNAIRKHKKNNFFVETICQSKDKKTALNLEKFWIKEFNSQNCKYGYNITAGGEGTTGLTALKGRKLTKNHRKKISEAKKRYFDGGGKSWNLGKTHSQETRNKISKAQKGRCSPMKGKKHTEISKELNRIVHLGKKWDNERKEKHSIIIKKWWEERKLCLSQ
jgi:group I intron endonuclease